MLDHRRKYERDLFIYPWTSQGELRGELAHAFTRRKTELKTRVQSLCLSDLKQTDNFCQCQSYRDTN